jgi:hypothetical protein
VLAAGPLLVAGAVVLGTALGTWVRFGLAPVAAVVGVGMVSLRLGTAGDPGWNGSSPLSTFGPQIDFPLLRPLVPVWWYVCWIVALTTVVAVVAVLRHRRDRPVWLVGIGAVVVGVVAAVAATRPAPTAEARHVADLVAWPEANQDCDAPTGSAVAVCTFAGYVELHDRVLGAVAPVGRALPAAAGTITVRQRFDGDVVDLPPEVRELVGTLPRPPADEVTIAFQAADDSLLAYRLRVAFAALGLPLEAEASERPLVIAGEARGVVALWLAARGLDPDDALDLAATPDGSDAFQRGLAWPTMCGPVVWSPQDLAAARQLLLAPEAEVSSVIAGGFDRWSDPATGTDEVLLALGLPPVGPQEVVVSQHESFC